MNRFLLLLCILLGHMSYAQRAEMLLEEGWHFARGEQPGAEHAVFDDSAWERVTVPHDWAIKGPFDKNVDMQQVAIVQDGETVPTEKTGRTGALPYIGVGWYRFNFDIPHFDTGKKVILHFDGAMSQAQVYVNGQRVGEHPYGYGYFYFDISPFISQGNENQLAVRLENVPESSRWYPGAGIYRNVKLIVKEQESIAHWGVTVTTPEVTAEWAKIKVRTKTSGFGNVLRTEIQSLNGEVLEKSESALDFDGAFEQNIKLLQPRLWSPEEPNLYQAVTRLYKGEQLLDEVTTRFGVRSISYSAEHGFQLNGKTRKFKGVCLHHDLGPLGVAINRAALRRQLKLMKDMGADAIRTAHNMPSIEQLELCDELGLMCIAESFDEWAVPKVKNGYHRFFDEWAEKDVRHLVKATRNHPSIVMWSSGNEVPDQWGSAGVKRAKRLQDIFHEEDPTRPVTVGMDQVKAVMESGFASLLDVPGLNYRTHLYHEAYEKFPQGMIIGSETASTVSSRGVYKFPVEEYKTRKYDDFQCSSYDFEACSWSNIPEDDFILQDDYPWVIGEFVWTGFDYLGEPTPYNEEWPSRSSYFGICDLAGIPKDRYYLYKSRWNTDEATLHILPHWNWEGREGEVTPVFVYTNYSKAELFVNGVSQGVRTKDVNSRLDRYRLRWMDVKYAPGELKVVAYDEKDAPVATKVMKTAGKPYALKLEADRYKLAADGKDLSFVTISVVDKAGNLCPNAAIPLKFKVKGAGQFKAACNGDATSLELFHEPTMHTFSGKLVVVVQAEEVVGTIQLSVKGKGLKSNSIQLESERFYHNWNVQTIKP